MDLLIDHNFLADAFLILSQDVVSFQYSWEAGENSKKILNSVQCLEQVSRTRNMFIVSSSCFAWSWNKMLWISAVVQFSHLESIFPPSAVFIL